MVFCHLVELRPTNRESCMTVSDVDQASEIRSTAQSTANLKAGLPHPVLTDYYEKEDQRQEFLNDMFDRNASKYDRNEKLIGFGTGSWYRRQALVRSGLKSGMSLVDVGFGTGLVSREALKIVGDPALITGVDPSPNMMAQAEFPEGTRLLEGSAESIPCADSSADFLSMGFALRHVSSLDVAFAEFSRVLKPGATVCLLEITPPASKFWNSVLRFYMSKVVPVLVRVISKQENSDQFWHYYWETIEACVPPHSILEALENAGFENVSRHVEVGIFSEYTATKPA